MGPATLDNGDRSIKKNKTGKIGHGGSWKAETGGLP